MSVYILFVSMYAYLHLTRFKHHVTNMTDVTGWAGSANPSGVPLFTSGFSNVRVAQYLVFCVVFCRSLLFVLFFFLFFNLLTIRLHVPLIYSFWYCWYLQHFFYEEINSRSSFKTLTTTLLCWLFLNDTKVKTSRIIILDCM